MHAFEIGRDDPGLRILDQRVQIVGDGHHGLVAAADHVAESAAGLLRERLRHRGEAAALTDHRDVAANELVGLGEERREARRHRQPRIDDADAVRAGQRESFVAARANEFLLQRQPGTADFGKAARPCDTGVDPGGRAFAHERRNGSGAGGEQRQVRRRRQVGDPRMAGDPMHFPVPRVDRKDRAGIAEFLQHPDGDAAQVARFLGGADHGDGAWREQSRHIGELRLRG